MRAGAQALSLLAVPLNVQVLTALDEEPLALVDLRRTVGSPPQTTLRGHLRTLTRLRIIHRRRQEGFPGPVDYELDTAGRSLIDVLDAVSTWLSDAPEGPFEAGNGSGRNAVKALVDGWSTRIVRALAGRPLSLTELNLVITNVTYPSLERRLAAMRLAGQIEARPSVGRSTPYGASEWLRRAVGPIAAALRWERAHVPESATPLGRIDAEALFLLAAPLVTLPSDITGRCRLTIEFRGPNGEFKPAGATVDVQDGRIVSCVSRLEGQATAWAGGSTADWLAALLEHETRGLEIGGDSELARDLVEGLHQALFAARLRS